MTFAEERSREAVRDVPRARRRVALALDPHRPGAWLYVRVLQTDPGAAGSSPFFAE